MSRRGLVASIIVTCFLTLACSNFARAQGKQKQNPEDPPRVNIASILVESEFVS
jgi:predicted small secreted protein